MEAVKFEQFLRGWVGLGWVGVGRGWGAGVGGGVGISGPKFAVVVVCCNL